MRDLLLFDRLISFFVKDMKGTWIIERTREYRHEEVGGKNEEELIIQLLIYVSMLRRMSDHTNDKGDRMLMIQC